VSCASCSYNADVFGRIYDVNGEAAIDDVRQTDGMHNSLVIQPSFMHSAARHSHRVLLVLLHNAAAWSSWGKGSCADLPAAWSLPAHAQTENIRIAYIDEIPAGKSSVTFKLNVVSVRQQRDTPKSICIKSGGQSKS
jgi:hypothetical protein